METGKKETAKLKSECNTGLNMERVPEKNLEQSLKQNLNEEDDTSSLVLAAVVVCLPFVLLIGIAIVLILR